MAVSKAEIERRMERFVKTYRSKGMKVTHQRMEVFRELAGTEVRIVPDTLPYATGQCPRQNSLSSALPR